MSLNRSEQEVYGYIHGNRDERQYWEQKVRAFAQMHTNRYSAAAVLDTELRRYCAERSPFISAVREATAGGTVSMRNLAEYLLRMWVPEPKKTKEAS
jgi:hypothetical protein